MSDYTFTLNRPTTDNRFTRRNLGTGGQLTTALVEFLATATLFILPYLLLYAAKAL